MFCPKTITNMSVSKVFFTLVVISIFLDRQMRTSGEMEDFLQAIHGEQVRRLLSSCCVVKDVMCQWRPSLAPITSPRHSATDDGDPSLHLQRFSQCICAATRRCMLPFTSFFVPDVATNVSYDVTFVTYRTTSKYHCNFLSVATRSHLSCERLQNYMTTMRTLAASGMVLGGAMGPLASMASAGLLGEAMEEALEQAIESGSYPVRPTSRSPSGSRNSGGLRASSCEGCVPLKCAFIVATAQSRPQGLEDVLVSFFAGGGGGGGGAGGRALTNRERYHDCLKQNSFRPQSIPKTTPPDVGLPEAPTQSDDDRPDSARAEKPTTTTTSTTTTTTTTTTLPTKTTTITTTTATSTSTSTTTTTTPSASTTTNPETTTSFPDLSTQNVLYVPNTTVTENYTDYPAMINESMASTSTVVVLPGVGEEEENDDGGGVAVTRTLLPLTTKAMPPVKYLDVENVVEDRGQEDIPVKGAEVPSIVVVGVATAAGVMAVCFFCLCFVRRRRRHRRKEKLQNGAGSGRAGPEDAAPSTANIIMGANGQAAVHYKTRPLPPVASIFKKMSMKNGSASASAGATSGSASADEASRDRRDPQKTTSMAERYVAPDFMTASSKPSLMSSASSTADGGESLYASLDETSMVPALHQQQPPLALGSHAGTEGLLQKSQGPPHPSQLYVNGSAKDSRGSDLHKQVASKQSGRYYNMNANPDTFSRNNQPEGSTNIPPAGNGDARRNSYVNVQPPQQSNNVYDHPSTQDQHEYSALSTGAGVGGGAGASRATGNSTKSGDQDCPGPRAKKKPVPPPKRKAQTPSAQTQSSGASSTAARSPSVLTTKHSADVDQDGYLVPVTSPK